LRVGIAISLLAILVATLVTSALTSAKASSGTTRQISSVGSTSLSSAPAASSGADDPAWPEFAGKTDNEPGPAPYAGSIFNRSNSKHSSNGSSANSGQKAKSNPELKLSFDGLNHRAQRTANGGNQFSLEPPDQGLCV